MARSLYICYFGVREPLVQTQVIPYLRELVKGGHEISLLTFEPAWGTGGQAAKERRIRGEGEKRKWEEGERRRKPDDQILRELGSDGIEWYSLRYHKRLSVVATAYDIFRGALFAKSMISGKRLDILHGRSHVPTLMAALAKKFSFRRPKLLFDIRGFLPEEYTDAGVWPKNGWIYHFVKQIERWLIERADGFVVLTEKARGILFPALRDMNENRSHRPVTVIPCCVDLTKFEIPSEEEKRHIRQKIGASDRFVIVYSGSLGGGYLTTETADFYAALMTSELNSFALILTQSEPEVIEPLLKERGMAAGDYLVTKLTPADVPRYLAAADAALSFCSPSYAKQAASPTKNAEYLALGLPIVANRNVGDVDKLIEESGIGVFVEGFDPENYRSAVTKLKEMGDIRKHCREVAKQEFDLSTVGGERYRHLYARLIKK